MYDWIDKDFLSYSGKIVGVDEAGRGPLAGPVVAAAVFLTEAQEKSLLLSIPFINDSKKLSEKKRNEIWDFVQENRICYAVGLSDVSTIDYYNILNSTNMAMNSALKKLKVPFELALIDGKNLSIEYPNRQIVNGDSRSLRIALASNIAKVVRDSIMRGFSKRYPLFGFEKNKGYGTKEHIHAIGRYGPTPFHRLTFKPLLEKIEKHILIEWLKYGQINSQRYEMILSKINRQFSQQKQLSGFFQ